MANVKRTSILLERDLVDSAAEALGTTTITETIHESMRQIVARETRRRVLAKIVSGDVPLPTMEDLRRWDDED
jgi:outer membrane lipopolysaccharide assembly protein LptE/RlpB